MEHLPKKTCQNGISYTLVGDYYIPDLQLPEENHPIGIWGRMYKAYLELYHPPQYNDLILSGKLWTYLADLNEQAQNQQDCIIVPMKTVERITEELKVHDQMAWVRAMNSIRNRAEEIIRTGCFLFHSLFPLQCFFFEGFKSSQHFFQTVSRKVRGFLCLIDFISPVLALVFVEQIIIVCSGSFIKLTLVLEELLFAALITVKLILLAFCKKYFSSDFAFS